MRIPRPCYGSGANGMWCGLSARKSSLLSLKFYPGGPYGLTVRPACFANAPCRASNVTNALAPRTWCAEARGVGHLGNRQVRLDQQLLGEFKMHPTDLFGHGPLEDLHEAPFQYPARHPGVLGDIVDLNGLGGILSNRNIAIRSEGAGRADEAARQAQILDFWQSLISAGVEPDTAGSHYQGGDAY
jgi:hypothetical protein